MVAGLAELLPPARDALHGEGGGIVVDAKVDPTGIGGDVIDAVGRALAQFRDDEIVHPDRLGLAFGTQFATAILEVPDQLLLLRVDRDGRLSGSLERIDLRIDVFELGVAIRVARTLAGLAVRLQAEAQAAQQPPDQLLAGGKAALGQRAGEMALALADPQARRLRIATDRRLHQLAERLPQPRFGLGFWLAPAPCTPPAIGRRVLSIAQFRHSPPNRAARNPGHRCTCRPTPTAQCI